MTWRAAVAIALAVTAALGCGWKSGLVVGARRDAGPRDGGLDARVVDAPPGIDAPLVDAPVDGPPDACEPIQIELRVTPTVLLLVDQSASMDAEVSAGRTRWTLLRDALVGPDALVTRLQARVRFGLSMYSARSEFGDDGGPPIGACPLLTTVPPALDNLAAIRSVYATAVPIEDTPTGDAIDETLARFRPLIDPRLGPTIIVLATDGEPDRCEELDPSNGQAEAVSAAQRAFMSGVRTFVINLGEDLVSRRHLQDMANAGLGRGPGDRDAEFWEATNLTQLRRALDAIVRDEVACTLVLERRIVPARACGGTVTLNGRPLVCDDPNGWRAVDPTHIEILGDACMELSAVPGSSVDVRLPCDALAP